MMMNVRSIVVATLISISGYSMVPEKLFDATKDLGAEKVIDLKFDARKTFLTKDQKEDLSKFFQEVFTRGKISEVKLLSWSDLEYPAGQKRLSQNQVRIAKHRNEEISNYLEKTLNVPNISVYNMAERPNGIEKFLHLSDAKVKDTLENRGDLPKNQKDTGFLGIKGQASKALILVYFDKE